MGDEQTMYGAPFLPVRGSRMEERYCALFVGVDSASVPVNLCQLHPLFVQLLQDLEIAQTIDIFRVDCSFVPEFCDPGGLC